MRPAFGSLLRLVAVVGVAVPLAESASQRYGSTSRPTLSIAGSAPAGTTWVQFLVDSTGRADSTAALLPVDTDPVTVATVKMVLPRLRFSPARRAGMPTCELLQMQVNLNGGTR